jgi:hypothetical protein
MNEHAGCGSRARSAGVVMGTTAALVVLLSWLWPDLVAIARGGLAQGPFEVALARAAAVVAALCAGWWWTVTCVIAAATFAGASPARRRGCPGWWHRAVLGACGVAIVSTLSGPAHATGESGPSGDAATLVQGLPLPDRPLGSLVRSRPPSPRPASAAEVVTVAAGDSLWSLAAARLPRGASDGEIDAAWRRLYAVNRSTIGPDPDLIHSGLRLRIPGARP